MVNLVKIEGNRYSFYKGKQRLVTVESVEPMDADWIEFYRKVPEVLLKELSPPELA